MGVLLLHRRLNYPNFLFFLPLLGDFVVRDFVLFTWANVKITVIKNIGYVSFDLLTLNLN
jgi:hypothetical protein